MNYSIKFSLNKNVYSVSNSATVLFCFECIPNIFSSAFYDCLDIVLTHSLLVSLSGTLICVYPKKISFTRGASLKREVIKTHPRG